MSAKELAFVACRVLALYWVLTAFLNLPSAIYTKVVSEKYLGGASPGSPVATFLEVNFQFILIGLYLIVGALLFGRAEQVSKLLAGKPDSDPTPITLRSSYRLGMTLVGLFVGLTWLPGLIENSWTFLTRSESTSQSERPYYYATLIGAALVVALIVWSIRNGIRASRMDNAPPPE